jgi:hypothetical protein
MLMVWEIQWEIKEVRGTLGDSSGKGNAHESMANFTKIANCTALGAIGGRSEGTSMLGGLRPGLGCPPEHGSDSESEPCSSGAARAAGAPGGSSERALRLWQWRWRHLAAPQDLPRPCAPGPRSLADAADQPGRGAAAQVAGWPAGPAGGRGLRLAADIAGVTRWALVTVGG